MERPPAVHPFRQEGGGEVDDSRRKDTGTVGEMFGDGGGPEGPADFQEEGET